MPGIEPDFRSILKNKLNYLHDFSLRKRLKMLATKYAAFLQPFIGTPEEFSVSVSELRNKLTHADLQTLEAGSDYLRLVQLCTKMALLYAVYILEVIGFDEQQIKAIIPDRSKRASRLRAGWI